MPSFCKLRCQGATTRWPPSPLSRYSSSMRCPALLRRFTVCTVQPSCRQQGLGFAQVGAQAAESPSGAWWHRHGAKRCRGQIYGHKAASVPVLRRWAPPWSRKRVAKNAVHPLVGTVEHLAVHPLIVQRQPQGLAHAHILQFGQAGVEHIALETPVGSLCCNSPLTSSPVSKLLADARGVPSRRR